MIARDDLRLGARILATLVALAGVWPTLVAWGLAVAGGWSVITSLELAAIGLAGTVLLVALARIAIDVPVRRRLRIASVVSVAWLALASAGFFFADLVLRDISGGTA